MPASDRGLSGRQGTTRRADKATRLPSRVGGGSGHVMPRPRACARGVGKRGVAVEVTLQDECPGPATGYSRRIVSSPSRLARPRAQPHAREPILKHGRSEDERRGTRRHPRDDRRQVRGATTGDRRPDTRRSRRMAGCRVTRGRSHASAMVLQPGRGPRGPPWSSGTVAGSRSGRRSRPPRILKRLGTRSPRPHLNTWPIGPRPIATSRSSACARSPDPLEAGCSTWSSVVRRACGPGAPARGSMAAAARPRAYSK
jgi:hypothetical protein